MVASSERRTLARAWLPAIAALAWASPALPHGAPGESATPKPGPGHEIRPYSARYALYRNGRLSGRLDVTLQRQSGHWTLTSEGAGTHGLARILAARDAEEVSGHIRDRRFVPDRYTRHTRMATLDDRWAFEFDWESRRVSVVHGRKDAVMLDMVGDPLDPLTLKLEMRQRLRQPNAPLRFHMVEENEIGEQNFRVLPRELMETSLGCLETTPVERIRQGSTRYTRAWHAADLDNVEVRMEHGKSGGNHFEMRITELRLDSVEITPRPGCAALQSGEGPRGSGPP